MDQHARHVNTTAAGENKAWRSLLATSWHEICLMGIKRNRMAGKVNGRQSWSDEKCSYVSVTILKKMRILILAKICKADFLRKKKSIPSTKKTGESCARGLPASAHRTGGSREASRLLRLLVLVHLFFSLISGKFRQRASERTRPQGWTDTTGRSKCFRRNDGRTDG